MHAILDGRRCAGSGNDNFQSVQEKTMIPWTRDRASGLYVISNSVDISLVYGASLIMASIIAPSGQHYLVKKATVTLAAGGAMGPVCAIFLVPSQIPNGFTANGLTSVVKMSNYLLVNNWLRLDRYPDIAQSSVYGSTAFSFTSAEDIIVPSGYSLCGGYADFAGIGGAIGNVSLQAEFTTEENCT